jgi:ribose 5-phosphate isomerase A
MTVEQEKAVAASAAAELVQDEMTVGLGTGSTVAYLIPALAARLLRITCVATSPTTATLAASHGLAVVEFEHLARLDLAIDGADQVDPQGWLVKGGGGAHTREKIVAAAADRFIVIVSSNKLVDRLAAPIPLELMRFGLDATLQAVGQVAVRAGAAPTPDGGVLADYTGVVDDPAEVSARLESIPGVVAHGLFPRSMLHQIVVGRGDRVEQFTLPG